jgi:hypothetical protein
MAMVTAMVMATDMAMVIMKMTRSQKKVAGKNLQKRPKLIAKGETNSFYHDKISPKKIR